MMTTTSQLSTTLAPVVRYVSLKREYKFGDGRLYSRSLEVLRSLVKDAVHQIIKLSLVNLISY